jgi:class 3 adenylate cyclase
MVQERPVRVERRLSAILAADVAGYSRLMHHDEEATHANLTALLTETVHPAIAEHGGRIVKNTNSNYPFAHFELAAALSLIGALDDARAAAKEGLSLDPTFTIRRLKSIPTSGDPKFRAASRRILKGMRMAGVPEG